MGRVHYDDPVPVPEGSHIASGRVLDLIPRGGGLDPRKKLIGKLCPPDFDRGRLLHPLSEDTVIMFPNDSYFDRHSAEYLAYNPSGKKKIYKHHLVIGLYALVLTIVTRIGLYDILVARYGALAANAILDFAMFSIVFETNESNTFTEWMQNYVLFTVKPYSDTWYSDFRMNTMSEDINHAVREDWIELNVREGNVSDVVISLDDTNFNCLAKKIRLAAYGNAKSHIHIPIVGMTVVIISSGEHKGRPLTYLPHKGSMPDKVSIFKMLAFWQGKGIHPKLDVLDRGYLTDLLVNELLNMGIDFQAMMTESSNAHKVMFEKYALELRTQVKYMMETAGIFGVSQENIFPFQNSKNSLYASLFYDSINGPQRATHLLEKVLQEKLILEGKIKEKQSNNEDDEEFSRKTISKYLKKEVLDGVLKITIDFDMLQPDWFAKGYSTMVSSLEQTAEQMNKDYDLRDACEKFFTTLKTMLGFAVAGAHTEGGWLALLFIGFIASIIRNEIALACSAERVDTSKFIADLCNITFVRSGDVYGYDGNFPKRVADVLKHFEMDKESIRAYEEYVNLRYNSEEGLLAVRSQPREIPEEKKPADLGTDADDISQDQDSANQRKKRSGRNTGSKNKKTLEREKQRQELRAAAGLPPEEPVKEKRGPGRPKGSISIKTLERMAEERRKRIEAGLPPDEPQTEKKIGRPLGHKNKKTLLREQKVEKESLEDENLTDQDEESPEENTHKGRTAGTKNKKTILREQEEATQRTGGEKTPIVPKRGRGRPKGSRNKALVAQEAKDAELSKLTGIDILSGRTKKKRDKLRRLAEEKASALFPPIPEET